MMHTKDLKFCIRCRNHEKVKRSENQESLQKIVYNPHQQEARMAIGKSAKLGGKILRRAILQDVNILVN